jgi:hypothetical protein
VESGSANIYGEEADGWAALEPMGLGRRGLQAMVKGEIGAGAACDG